MTHVVVTIDFEHYNTKINPLYCNDIEEAEEEEYEEYEEEYEEEEDEKVCRICLETNGHLINVCGCKGSVKYVHKECIEKWQNVAPTLENRTHCQLCKQKFENIQKINKIDDSIVLCLLLSLISFTAIIIVVYFV